jgi:hypothetical protein
MLICTIFRIFLTFSGHSRGCPAGLKKNRSVGGVKHDDPYSYEASLKSYLFE